MFLFATTRFLGSPVLTCCALVPASAFDVRALEDNPPGSETEAVGNASEPVSWVEVPVQHKNCLMQATHVTARTGAGVWGRETASLDF